MDNIILKLYVCKICGTKIDWETGDDHKGSVWSCEELNCGKAFCRQCFIDKHGVDSFVRMVNEDDIIRCPTCYEKHLKGVQNESKN